MKITFITKFTGLTILGRLTKMQICNVLERDESQRIKKIQTLSGYMLSHFETLPTYESGLTSMAKKDFLKMMEKVGIGGRFYVTDDWISVTPARVNYAQRFLHYLDAGLSYKDAHDQAIKETSDLAHAEIQQGISGTFVKEQEIFIKQNKQGPYPPTQHPMNAMAHIESVNLK